MKTWWRQRSLRLRLALWYAAVSFVVLLALGALLWTLVDRRLRADLDRQLRADFDFVAVRLEDDGAGAVAVDYEHEEERRPEIGVDNEEQQAEARAKAQSAAAWFEVWSSEGKLLLCRRPGEGNAHDPGLALPPPTYDDGGGGDGVRFFSARTGRLPVRGLERATRVDRLSATLRVVRSEADLRQVMGEVGAVLALGLPLAAVLSAASGYLVARRALRPVEAMAVRARQITATNLGARLAVENPHDELGRLAVVFNDTLARLEGSFAELRRFAADASHELRTPLTALRAVGEASLREAETNPHGAAGGTWREAVGSMLEEAHRLGELVDALLLLARVDGDAATSPAAPETFALGPMLAEVRESLLALAEERGQRIQIETGPPPCAEVVVRADPILLRQVLLNLVHNAIRYGPDRGTVTLRLRGAPGGGAVIAVSDEGPGIAPEHQGKVFERFFRVDPARTRGEGGAGLGLAIARRSVERLGGRIELESTPGAGSTFRVVLPPASGVKGG